MKKINFIYLKHLNLGVNQIIKQVFASFGIFLFTAFFASLQASMTITFRELINVDNDYGGTGVEVSWAGSLNVDGLSSSDFAGNDRVFLRSNENENTADNNKIFHFVASEAGFSRWDASDLRTSDAFRGAIIPDPIFDPQGSAPLDIFVSSPGKDSSSSEDVIVTGDAFGFQQVVYNALLQRTPDYDIITPIGYVSGESIIGSAFFRNLEFTDLYLPALQGLIDADEAFETSFNFGSDTITYRVVPEPSTCGLIFGGLIFVAMCLKKRKQLKV